MQRHALVPIAQFLQDRAKDQKVDLIELGCGTGRFHTFLRDNLPPDANTIALDLSPFYLEHAKRNDRRWRRLRAAEAVKPATFIHAAAESVPLPSESQDIVVMVYLLHECPSDARRSLAAEAARLLRPGGLCVVADSIQLGDRPALDSSLAVFKDFNEVGDGPCSTLRNPPKLISSGPPSQPPWPAALRVLYQRGHGRRILRTRPRKKDHGEQH